MPTTIVLGPRQNLNMVLVSYQTADHQTSDEVAAGLDVINEVDAGPDPIDDVDANPNLIERVGEVVLIDLT